MDAQQFLAEFGHIANAPGGIERLRELIYQFAVTGKLVPQQADDGSVQVELDNVARIRERLIAEKKWKRAPKLESAPLALPAIELPPSWQWSRLLDLGEINPRNLASQEAKATFVPMAAVSEKHGEALAGKEANWPAISKGYTHFANGDVLLAKITPCFENGKAAVVCGLKHGIGAGSTEFHVFRPMSEGVHSGYVYLFLRSPLFRVRGEASMTGTAGQKRLPTDYFALCAMPFPPKTEQSRIVGKVDELMALCDTLEGQQQARRALQNKLRQSTLQAVASAVNPHELQVSWTRLNTSFSELFSSSRDVGTLRTLILELAVRGLLTEQKATDAVAELNVSEIRRLASGSSETGRRKKNVTYRAIEEEELNYQCPEGWAFARLGELVRVLNGRAYSKPELLQKGTPVLRVGNLFTSKDWYYSNLDLDADKYCNEGDLLYAWSASFGPFIWPGPKAIFHYHIWKLDLFSGENLSRDFLYLVLQERTEAIKSSGHGISMAHMTKEKMEQLPIAVPPLDEQHRIVARVSELMRFCEEIEHQLRESEKVAERLATSAVVALTGISIEQEEEPMKAPQTELISPLRLGTAPNIKAQAPLATMLARHHGEMSAKDLWQRFGGEIDTFYAQLKIEVAQGWILEPAPAEMREKPADAVSV